MRGLLVLLALAAAPAGAQAPPTWVPPPAGAFPERMSVTGVVQTSGRELRSRDDRVAAFVDGQVRGVAAPTLVGSRRVFFLSVAGDAGDGPVSFRAYDALAGRVLDVQPDLGFDPLRPAGSVAAPVVWTPVAGGGPPAWTVDPAAFSASMAVVGRVERAGVALAEPGARVGAFLNGQLRGAATLQDAGGQGPRAFLAVYGEPGEAGALTFRVYLPSADRTFAVAASVPFATETTVGTVGSPAPLPLRPGAALPGPEGWQMLAPPGTDATVGALLATVWTQGFPGAGDAGGQANVLRYTETAGGFAPVAAASEAWPRGEGRFVYVYADDDPRTPPVDGGFPKTLPAVGLGSSGGFTFALTFTPGNGEPEGAGWNLLGNPFDEGVDWDLGWTRAGVSNSVYVWDPAYLGGGYRVWNGVAGSLAGGVVPRGRAFWAQATAASPVLAAPAAAQVAEVREGVGVPVLAFRLASAARPGLGTEAWVTFQAGAHDALDAFDAWALAPLVADYVALGSAEVSDTRLLSVDARGPDPSGPVSVPLTAAAVAAGLPAGDDLVLSWPGLDVPAGWALALVDTETGARVDLRADSAYAFSVAPPEVVRPGGADGRTAPALHRLPPGPARFRLEVTPGQITASDAERPEPAALHPPAPNPARGDVAVTFVLAEAGPARLALFDVLGRRVLALADGPRAAGAHTVGLDAARLPAGVYVVRLDAAGAVRTVRLTVAR